MIRKIAEEDLPQMLRIWNQHYKVLTSTEKKHTLNSLKEWYKTRKRGRHEYFGLFEDGQLKGFMILKYMKRELWIKMLAVDIKERKKGYGTNLLKFAVKEAKDKDLFCEVKIENISAINFFFKNKFKVLKFNSKMNEYILKYSP